MTKILRYNGTHKKGKIKIGDYPDYEGKPTEVIYDPMYETITVSTKAAEMIMQQYPGLFTDLNEDHVVPPTIDVDGVMGNQSADPPDTTRRKR